MAAPGLNDRGGNPYVARRQLLVDRGRIISADGQVLARSVPRRVHGQREFLRAYPKGSLAPHVVGYTGDPRTGLEDSQNDYLAGSYGTQGLLERFNLRVAQGADVHIALDTRVQAAAATALAGRKGAVVALVPRTGAILALASSPTYNLNDVHTRRFATIRSDPGQPLFDRAAQGREPPGSTFKVVTATAALESGRYSPTSQFVDTGQFVVNGQAITNFAHHVYGPNDLTEALTKSINTTFARIGQDLGAQRLGAAMSAYGFGIKPSIDLPPEEVATSGRLRNGKVLPNDQQGEDAARIAIGQERVVATPLQMAMVAGAIANGGKLMEPYLVTRVTDRGGSTVHEGHPRSLGQAATPEVAAELTAMMQKVVQEGTGTAAALSGLAVAGKTGTAETGGGLNQAWFIGFAPAEQPAVAVAVLIENTTGTGGVEAAPVAARVMKAALGAGR